MMSEEQKAKMALGREKAKKNKEVGIPPEGTGNAPQEDIKADFEAFKEEQKAQNNKMLSILETLVNKDKVVGQTLDDEPLEEVKVNVADELQPLTANQRLVFEKYFDPLDGFKAWYNVNENIFTVEVPEKFSNVSQAHKVLYKQDLRSKKVDQNNIIGSMEGYCRLICQNLKYNRKLRLK